MNGSAVVGVNHYGRPCLARTVVAASAGPQAALQGAGMSPTNHAIFLSYASEDLEAAARIAGCHADRDRYRNTRGVAQSNPGIQLFHLEPGD